MEVRVFQEFKLTVTHSPTVIIQMMSKTCNLNSFLLMLTVEASSYTKELVN